MAPALLADPAGHRGRTPAGGDGHIGPRRRELVRAGAIDPEKGGAEARAQHRAEAGERGEGELLDLIGPAQGLGEADRLGGVARLAVVEHPDGLGGAAVTAIDAAARTLDHQPPAQVGIARAEGLEQGVPPGRLAAIAGDAGEDEAFGLGEQRRHDPGYIAIGKPLEAYAADDAVAGPARRLVADAVFMDGPSPGRGDEFVGVAIRSAGGGLARHVHEARARPLEIEELIAGRVGGALELVPHLSHRVAGIDEALRRRPPGLGMEAGEMEQLRFPRTILVVAGVPLGGQPPDQAGDGAGAPDEAILAPPARRPEGPDRGHAGAIHEHHRGVDPAARR